MRKIKFLFLIICFLPVNLYAASISGANTLGKGKFSAGLDGDYVFKRALQSKGFEDNILLRGAGPGGVDVNLVVETNSASPDLNKFYRPMVKASYGVLDNLDLYVKLGTSKGRISQVDGGSGLEVIPGMGQIGYDVIDSNTQYNIDTAFNWGVGLKGAYPIKLFGGLILGCDLQYLRSENDYYAIQERNFYLAPPPNANVSYIRRWTGSLTIQEWQAAPYIAKKFGKFTPYVGAKYSDVRIKDRPKSDLGEFYVYPPAGPGDATSAASQSYTNEYESEHIIGSFVGLDYNINDSWKINLEGRFIDEYSAGLDVSCKF